MPDKMKCPFRQKDGEFLDCYGKECMAFFEFQPFSCASEDTIPQCRKFVIQQPYQPVPFPQAITVPYQKYCEVTCK